MVTRLAFDTNAYSAYADANDRVVEIVRGADAIGLPVIVLGELYNGFMSGTRLEYNLVHVRQFMTSSRLEILQINEETAWLFGEVASGLKKIGKPIQQNDVWIAALCKQYGYSLATNDTGFDYVIGLEAVHYL